MQTHNRPPTGLVSSPRQETRPPLSGELGHSTFQLKVTFEVLNKQPPLACIVCLVSLWFYLRQSLNLPRLASNLLCSLKSRSSCLPNVPSSLKHLSSRRLCGQRANAAGATHPDTMSYIDQPPGLSLNSYLATGKIYHPEPSLPLCGTRMQPPLSPQL